MVYFEHQRKDGYALRILDIPYEDLKLELPTIQVRIPDLAGKNRIINFIVHDPDRKEGEPTLFDDLVEGLFQHKLKKMGTKCDKCEALFLPKSPAQRHCDDCKRRD